MGETMVYWRLWGYLEGAAAVVGVEVCKAVLQLLVIASAVCWEGAAASTVTQTRGCHRLSKTRGTQDGGAMEPRARAVLGAPGGCCQGRAVVASSSPEAEAQARAVAGLPGQIETALPHGNNAILMNL